MKKDKKNKNSPNLEETPYEDPPKKENKQKIVYKENTILKPSIITIDLTVGEKKCEIDIYPKETSFDVIKRSIDENKLEVFFDGDDDTNSKRKKMRNLASILQNHINQYIQELSDYIEKKRKEKFKVFKPKSVSKKK